MKRKGMVSDDGAALVGVGVGGAVDEGVGVVGVDGAAVGANLGVVCGECLALLAELLALALVLVDIVVEEESFSTLLALVILSEGTILVGVVGREEGDKMSLDSDGAS